MAAPHVAGVAALALSLDASISYGALRDAILDSAVPIDATEGKTATAGRLNALGTIREIAMLGTALSPADESVVYTPPTEFLVDYSRPYDPNTVTADDLRINGIAADAVTLTDADTLTFSFDVSPVTDNGVQSGQIPAGAIAASDSAALNDPLSKVFAFSFLYDEIQLAVTATSPEEHSALTLPFDQLESASHAAVSQTGMKGFDGAWAFLYGDEPITPETLTVSVDEDTFADSERAHRAEQAAYLVFDDKPVADMVNGPYLRSGIASGISNIGWTTVSLDRSYEVDGGRRHSQL